jgi:hypothetical protein
MSRIVLADPLPSMSTVTTKTLRPPKPEQVQTEELVVDSDNTDNIVEQIQAVAVAPVPKMIKIRGASNKMRRVKGSLYF